MRGPSPVAAGGGHSSSRCAGLSLSRPLLLRSTGSRRAGSAIVAHGPSCSAACGIFPDRGSNPCPLHWQADSQPLRHQGSPTVLLLILLEKMPFSIWKDSLHLTELYLKIHCSHFIQYWFYTVYHNTKELLVICKTVYWSLSKMMCPFVDLVGILIQTIYM